MIDSTTTAGLYDPVYYALVGWPSLIFDDVTAIYAMRILSSILTALFLAFTISIAYGWKRNALPLMSLALASPPMLLFLGGSVNPNAVETTATLAAFAAMLGLTIFPDSRLILARSAILLAGVAVAVTSRGLSPLWLAIAVLLPLLLSNWSHIRALMREVPVRCAIAGATIATVFALLWTFATNSLAGASASSSFSFPGVGSTPFAGFLNTVRDTFGYAQGMIGNFGWLDTPAPLGVYFVWSALVGSLLLTAFTVLRGRPLFFVAALFVLVVVLPALIQGAYVTSGGIIWQGRYTLPLFSIAVFGTAALTAQHTRVVSSASWSRFGFLIWLVCAAAQFASFATALRRYAVGANGTWPNTFFYPAWTAPGGNILWVAVFTLVLAATTFLAWRLSTSSDFSTRQRQRLA